MPIRDHRSPQSNIEKLEKEWFKKAEMLENDINRFLFMPKGTRKKSWVMKLDLDKIKTEDEIDWMIDQDKFINRPDAIAYKFYGNSKYWWIIALRNEITDPFNEFHKGKKLKIPNLSILKRRLGF